MVIDASVAFKLVVAEPDSERAIDWLTRIEFTAPSLVHIEVANALWKRVLRGELDADEEISERLKDLGRYFRTLDEIPHLPRAFRLAVELQHPVYGCVYLALAEANDDELLTADHRFFNRVSGTMHADRVRSLDG